MANFKPHAGLPSTQPGGLAGPSRFLVSAAAFVVIVAGMKAAVDIIVPFLLSVFLAVISTPALFWLKAKGLSTFGAILLVSLTILIAGVLAGTILTASIADFSKDLPSYTAKLNSQFALLEDKWDQWARQVQLDFKTQQADLADTQSENAATATQADDLQDVQQESASALKDSLDAKAAIKLVADLLSQIGSLITKGFLIYLTTVFILLEASILPSKIKTSMMGSPDAFENLCAVAADVKKYLSIKTCFSLTNGVLVAIMLKAIGVKYPILWGLISFLLNFVPNLGSIIAAVPACLLALVQLGPVQALVAAAGYILIEVTLGNIIEPRLMGQRLGLSTLVVFLSLVFWGWVLGPVGMLLSVPLTMTVKIVLQSHPDTRKLAILLGSHKPGMPLKKAVSN